MSEDSKEYDKLIKREVNIFFKGLPKPSTRISKRILLIDRESSHKLKVYVSEVSLREEFGFDEILEIKHGLDVYRTHLNTKYIEHFVLCIVHTRKLDSLNILIEGLGLIEREFSSHEIDVRLFIIPEYSDYIRVYLKNMNVLGKRCLKFVGSLPWLDFTRTKVEPSNTNLELYTCSIKDGSWAEYLYDNPVRNVDLMTKSLGKLVKFYLGQDRPRVLKIGTFVDGLDMVMDKSINACLENNKFCDSNTFNIILVDRNIDLLSILIPQLKDINVFHKNLNMNCCTIQGERKKGSDGCDRSHFGYLLDEFYFSSDFFAKTNINDRTKVSIEILRYLCLHSILRKENLISLKIESDFMDFFGLKPWMSLQELKHLNLLKSEVKSAGIREKRFINLSPQHNYSQEIHELFVCDNSSPWGICPIVVRLIQYLFGVDFTPIDTPHILECNVEVKSSISDIFRNKVSRTLKDADLVTLNNTREQADMGTKILAFYGGITEVEIRRLNDFVQYLNEHKNNGRARFIILAQGVIDFSDVATYN